MGGYITKEEFNDIKQSLRGSMKCLKSLVVVSSSIVCCFILYLYINNNLL